MFEDKKRDLRWTSLHTGPLFNSKKTTNVILGPILRSLLDSLADSCCILRRPALVPDEIGETLLVIFLNREWSSVSGYYYKVDRMWLIWGSYYETGNFRVAST